MVLLSHKQIFLLFLDNHVQIWMLKNPMNMNRYNIFTPAERSPGLCQHPGLHPWSTNNQALSCNVEMLKLCCQLTSKFLHKTTNQFANPVLPKCQFLQTPGWTHPLNDGPGSETLLNFNSPGLCSKERRIISLLVMLVGTYILSKSLLLRFCFFSSSPSSLRPKPV